KEKTTTTTIVITSINILNLKTRNSSIGTSSTSCLQINNPIIKIPAPMEPRTMALVQPFSEATLKPYRKAPKPTDDMIIDKMSIFGLRKSVTLFKYKNAMSIVMATIGSIVKNKACQLKCTSRQTDKVGPIAGPNAMTTPIKPIAVSPSFHRNDSQQHRH